LQIGQIEPPVQSGHTREPIPTRQREMQIVDVEVDDIELAATMKYLFQQADVMRELIDTGLVEAQRTRDDRDQSRRRHRIAARKERHVVTLRHELFGEIRDDPLGPAVERGRNALVQRRDLSDT
jgi:hypothetical protein